VFQPTNGRQTPELGLRRPLREENYMVTDLPALTLEIIEQFKSKVNPETGKKYTQSDIARMWGVSRQYVSKVKVHSGQPFSRSPRELATQSFPWPNIPAEHNQHHYAKRLHDHAEYMILLGDDMPFWKLYELRNFYRMLQREDAVVEYDPHVKSTDKDPYGGWRLVPRKPEDQELIIRVNEYTIMYPESDVIWSWPPEFPNV
jgi:hypothetical protein